MDMWTRDAGFTALVNAYAGDLFRFAYWLCRNRDDAEDLVQETFARAWKFLDTLQDETAAKSWLLTTLRREHARRYERSRVEDHSIPLDGMEVADTHRDLDDSVEAFNLHRALAEMPVEYREPLVLQVLGGYSCKEIGAMIDASESAVMTRLFRARQRLRLALAGEPSAGAGEPKVNTL